MKVLSSLEIQAIVSELQIFVNSRVDQVYQPDNTELVLALHRSDIGKKLLRIVPGTTLYIASQRRPSPKEALNFCRFLRKRLGPTRVKEIVQKNGERIVEFHFEGKETYFILIAEFFSKGNLILCDKEYTIISALQVQLWKDRKIKAKVKYEYPPQRKNIFSTVEEFQKHLEGTKKESIVKTLALGVNIGGVYAEEICARAHVPKETPEPTKEQYQNIFKELQDLIKEGLSPNLIDGQPYPIEMKSKGKGQPCTSYNESLDKYYAQFIDATEQEERDKEPKEKKSKYEELIAEQNKQLLQIDRATEENQKKAEYIYAHYMEIKELLDLFKQKNFEELKKRGIQIEGKNILLEIQ